METDGDVLPMSNAFKLLVNPKKIDFQAKKLLYFSVRRHRSKIQQKTHRKAASNRSKNKKCAGNLEEWPENSGFPFN